LTHICLWRGQGTDGDRKENDPAVTANKRPLERHSIKKNSKNSYDVKTVTVSVKPRSQKTSFGKKENERWKI